MKSYILVLLVFFFSFTITGKVTLQNPIDREDPLINSFDTIFRPAANADGYSVVKNSDLSRLKSTLSDSIKRKEAQLLELKKEAALLKNNKDTLRTVGSAISQPQEMTGVKGAVAEDAADSNIVYILAIGCLLLVTAFFGFRIVMNRQVVRAAKEQVAVLEQDFEAHKRNSLERERKLMRELIDAQNANLE